MATLGCMNSRRLFIMFTAVALSGCDAWFFRRIDVVAQNGASFSVNSASTSALLSTVREYAAELGLPCQETNRLPIECYKQPVRVWAVLTERGVSVCYYATGAPFEKSKFEARITRLEAILVSRFGVTSVSSQATQCAPPPSFGRSAAQQHAPPGRAGSAAPRSTIAVARR